MNFRGLMARIITPLAFALIGYLLLFAAFGSYITPLAGVWSLITSGSKIYEGESLMENRLDGYTDAVPSSVVTFPKHGDSFGEIRIPSAEIKAPLYYGDSEAMLKKGICQYLGSMYIGSGTTALLSGHNNTYLHTLGQVAVGDKIEVDTNYGSYVYEVEKVGVYRANDASWYDLDATEENLVIYTCYPFNALGITQYRYAVNARYISGPRILYEE